MIKLLKFCKQYNLNFKLRQEDVTGSTLLYFTRNDSNYRCSILITHMEIDAFRYSDDDAISDAFINKVIDILKLNENGNVIIPESFVQKESYREYYAEYKQLTIEQMLQRADVVWFDDIMANERVCVSYNEKAPLTGREQSLIVGMWRSEGYVGNIKFKVAEVKSNDKL